MPVQPDDLRADLLQMHDRFVGLVFNVCADLVAFSVSSSHVVGLLAVAILVSLDDVTPRVAGLNIHPGTEQRHPFDGRLSNLLSHPGCQITLSLKHEDEFAQLGEYEHALGERPLALIDRKYSEFPCG